VEWKRTIGLQVDFVTGGGADTIFARAFGTHSDTDTRDYERGSL